MQEAIFLILKHFQNLISEVSSIAQKEIGITDEDGVIIACSNKEKIRQNIPLTKNIEKTDEISLLYDGDKITTIYTKSKHRFVIYIITDDFEDKKYLSLISLNICTLLECYDINHKKLSFINKVINGNIDNGEIFLFTNEFHISNTSKRVVFLIRTEDIKEFYVHEVIERLFPDRNRDFVIDLNNREIVLIKEFRSTSNIDEIEKTAKSIYDTLQTEIMISPKIGIGTAVTSLEKLNKSYEEARTSLKIGSIFNPESYVFMYGNLGIGRLISQLPPNVCKLFLQEFPKYSSFDSLDEEDLRTINAFFKCDLNISETSRKLYIHRNTLIYRLEKINKLTGLDIMRFDDAATLKIVLLVKQYMNSF